MLLGFNLLSWTTHITEENFPLRGELKRAGYDGVELPALEPAATVWRDFLLSREEVCRCGHDHLRETWAKARTLNFGTSPC